MVEDLPAGKSLNIIAGQIIRSATSVGANYRAARRAKSAKDFVYKLRVVLEEADETLYWLELIQSSGKIKPEKIRLLVLECNEVVAMLVQSLKTSEKKLAAGEKQDAGIGGMSGEVRAKS